MAAANFLYFQQPTSCTLQSDHRLHYSINHPDCDCRNGLALSLKKAELYIQENLTYLSKIFAGNVMVFQSVTEYNIHFPVNNHSNRGSSLFLLQPHHLSGHPVSRLYCSTQDQHVQKQSSQIVPDNRRCLCCRFRFRYQ